MSTSFHLCQPEDLSRLQALALRRAVEAGDDADPDHIRAGLAPLTEQTGDGAAYVFGPRLAPVGYLALTFTWSVAQAAREARVVDLYIRPSVRRRGLATEALIGIGNALRSGGITAFHAALPANLPELEALFRAAGFTVAPGPLHATRSL